MRKRQSGPNSLADQKVLICFTHKEYNQLHELLGVTDFKTMSGLIRELIEGTRVVARYPYTKFEKELQAISEIDNSLHILGVEIDRVTRDLYTYRSRDSILSIGRVAAFIYETVGEEIAPLNGLILSVAKKWLADADSINSSLN